MGSVNMESVKDAMLAQRIQLSSPGLTGRSSTPRRLGSTSGALEYWIPAYAGMTSFFGETRFSC